MGGAKGETEHHSGGGQDHHLPEVEGNKRRDNDLALVASDRPLICADARAILRPLYVTVAFAQDDFCPV